MAQTMETAVVVMPPKRKPRIKLDRANLPGAGREAVVRPLSVYLGTDNLEGLVERKGKGLAKYEMVGGYSDSEIFTLDEDSVSKVKEKILINASQRRSRWDPRVLEFIESGQGSAKHNLYEGPWRRSGVETEGTSADDDDDDMTSGLKYAVLAGTDDVDFGSNYDGKQDSRNTGLPTIPGQPTFHRTCDVVLRDFLENPFVTNVVIEGCSFDKAMLVKWALKYRPLDTMTMIDQCVQTDDVGASMHHLTSKEAQTIPGNAKEVCSQLGSNLPTRTTTAVVPTPSIPPPPLLNLNPGNSLMGTYVNPYPYQAHSYYQTPAFPGYPYEYTKALNWKPKDYQKSTALKQLKDDVYLVLIVGKGCKLNAIFSEYIKIIQESLDLSKAGLPNLETLLVKMKDMIFFKKECGPAGKVYVYPNLSVTHTESFSHIVEFVAEQRDALGVIPSPTSPALRDMDISELFEPIQRQGYYNGYNMQHQQTAHFEVGVDSANWRYNRSNVGNANYADNGFPYWQYQQGYYNVVNQQQYGQNSYYLSTRN